MLRMITAVCLKFDQDKNNNYYVRSPLDQYVLSLLQDCVNRIMTAIPESSHQIRIIWCNSAFTSEATTNHDNVLFVEVKRYWPLHKLWSAVGDVLEMALDSFHMVWNDLPIPFAVPPPNPTSLAYAVARASRLRSTNDIEFGSEYAWNKSYSAEATHDRYLNSCDIIPSEWTLCHLFFPSSIYYDAPWYPSFVSESLLTIPTIYVTRRGPASRSGQAITLAFGVHHRPFTKMIDDPRWTLMAHSAWTIWQYKLRLERIFGISATLLHLYHFTPNYYGHQQYVPDADDNELSNNTIIGSK